MIIETICGHKSSGMNDFEDELEVIFIAETFHKSQPIREKTIQSTIPRVWIKDKPKKVKDLNGVVIKQEPQPRVAINDRFTELMALRQQSGVVFETDAFDDEEADDDDYEDIADTTTEELLLGSSKGMKRSTKSNIAVNLAKKLKKRAIANRLGVAYNPANSKLRDMRSRLGTTKSWSEKFGRLLAAKKLLYLPLLFRKYKMGPKRTREELDIEIDLYMAEVRAKKLKLGYDQIKGAADSLDGNNNGLKLIDDKEMFGGFGGPGWKKRIKFEVEPPNRLELDMELDEYMANKND